MLSVSVAVRQGGTIELQSGVFDDMDAVALITSMTKSSHNAATEFLRETRLSGMCKRRADSFEVLAKVL